MNFPPIKYDAIMLQGGLDQVTPTHGLKPGVARSAINYECSATGGYTRVGGYERFDGRPAPSAAAYIILTVTGSTGPAIGSTITGATSGATGVLIARTGTTFVLTKVTGTFNGTENLTSGTTVGTQTGVTGASTQKQHAQYKALAADIYRADIGLPTGDGPLLGAFMLNDVTYCFRNNAGSTAANMWKSSSSGWTAVALFSEISFTAGNAVIADGTAITQLVSGATAVVKRQVLQSGAFAGGTAAGRLIITTITGTFDATNFIQVGGVTKATSASLATAITLLPSGKYQFCVSNFAGSASTVRVYGCDGVSRGFEFDGTTLVPIVTGASPDTPKFVAAHKKQLFFAVNASLIHSAPGLPYDYTALSGASEIATGNTITGMQVQPGSQTTGAIAIFNRTNTLILYGTGTATWNLVPFDAGYGAIPYSVQNMAQTYFMSDSGVNGLITSQNYGNFEQAALTAAIRPFITQHRANTVCSVICREKSQYRLYFSDGLGLHFTIVNGKYMGAMPIYYPINETGTVGLYNAWNGAKSNGDEVILGCGQDGYLYQIDKGTSFDGAAIGAALTLNYSSSGSPRVTKRYHKAGLEVVGSSYAEIDFFYLLGYGTQEYDHPMPTTSSGNMLNSNWDTAAWDTFFWDTSNTAPIECEMAGDAENVALTLNSSSNYFDSFTINSAIVHYIPRRGLR